MAALQDALESAMEGTVAVSTPEVGWRTAVVGLGMVALSGALLIGAPHGKSALTPDSAAPAAADDSPDPAPASASPQVAPVSPEQRVLIEFLSRRFRVAGDAVGTFVAAAFRAGGEQRVDPLLVLAVMAVESRFNPVAESTAGARGLMQVLPKFHQDKLAGVGGDAALLDPVLNIRIGTQILREYLRGAGDLEAGLQRYAGVADESPSQYADKVLSERNRMAQLLARQRRAGA